MLTKAFLKNLATKAHQLNPVIIIGNNGLTPGVHNEVEAALIAHELLKIRINAISRESREAMVNSILSQHQATKIQQIGHIVVIYRNNPDKKK
jgi:RNA-binding protein